MAIDLHHIRTFIHAYRLKSFHRAADVLNLTQPSITERIHTIEIALTQPVFDRTASGVVPNALGEELYQRCAALIDAIDEFARRARLHKGPVLTVGVVEDLVKAALAPIIARMHREKPDLAVLPEIGDRLQLTAGVRAGKLDLAVLAMVEPPLDLCWRPITSYEVGFLVPESSRIIEAATLWAQGNPTERLICPNANGAVYSAVARGLGRQGREWPVALEATSELIQFAVAKRRGIGACAAIKPNQDCPGVRLLVAEDFDRITLGILSRSNAGPDVQWMINLIVDEFMRIGPALAVRADRRRVGQLVAH